MSSSSIRSATLSFLTQPPFLRKARLAMASEWHTINIEIPFASHKHALIAKQAIEVDAELQPHAVKRELSVHDEKLIATFHTLTVRLARLTVNGFLENVDLVVRTIEVFGKDGEKTIS